MRGKLIWITIWSLVLAVSTASSADYSIGVSSICLVLAVCDFVILSLKISTTNTLVGLEAMTAIDEELEAQHPGWMDGPTTNTTGEG